MKQYAIGLYEKAMPSSLTIEEKLKTAKDLGYDYMELSIDETDEKLARLDWSETEIIEIVSAMNKIDLPIGSICLSAHRKYPLGSAEHGNRSLKIMKKAIALASSLGAKTIQLAGYDVYYENNSTATQERFIKNLKQCVQMAANAGIMLGFETMETDFMDTVWKSMFYVHLIDSPWLAVYPDTGNLTNSSLIYKKSAILDLQSGAGHLCALHLKETIPGKYREIPFGTGHVDFESMITVAWSLGVRRYVTEMWYVGQENWKEEIADAHQMMCAILNRSSTNQ